MSILKVLKIAFALTLSFCAFAEEIDAAIIKSLDFYETLPLIKDLEVFEFVGANATAPISKESPESEKKGEAHED